MSTEVGSIFVRDSGTKDHLLEVPLGSRLRKASGLVSSQEHPLRFPFLSFMEYAIRVAVFCACFRRSGTSSTPMALGFLLGS